MDSNTSSFVLNSSTFHSAFYQDKQHHDDGMIDLGLSLRTVQPEAYHSSNNCMSHSQSLIYFFAKLSALVSLGGYDDLMEWPQSNNLNLKSSSTMHSRSIPENFDEEIEGVQSNERWAYVKVNMDGVTVGRKICVLDHEGYQSLANQLENMFGEHRSKSISGLKLFQYGSEYSLFYKDREDQWRIVGDVPWKEFVECVKRLRIARKNAAFVSCSSSYT
ncbi:Auxin-responsive protein IAA32 [Senna tora]|uniref:Auxin-induced protein n=1 Tax=Senna tora TaxID=362788 RepID=A0A834SQP8_9FABA|nr:Auxin-responsive protein IAA32 [Senna tora]